MGLSRLAREAGRPDADLSGRRARPIPVRRAEFSSVTHARRKSTLDPGGPPTSGRPDAPSPTREYGRHPGSARRNSLPAVAPMVAASKPSQRPSKPQNDHRLLHEHDRPDNGVLRDGHAGLRHDCLRASLTVPPLEPIAAPTPTPPIDPTCVDRARLPDHVDQRIRQGALVSISIAVRQFVVVVEVPHSPHWGVQERADKQHECRNHDGDRIPPAQRTVSRQHLKVQAPQDVVR